MNIPENKGITPVVLAPGGERLYQLDWGDYSERCSTGPLLGIVGLNFDALAEDYRRDRYAAAESAREDSCSVDEDGFVGWLIEKGILRPVETTAVRVSITTSFDNAYVPRHWPECPECDDGRGELEYGTVRRSLNRIVTFRRCTDCRHEWAHQEEACDSRYPMLDDDGRDTPGACVPFSISKACGIPFADVLSVCSAHGWSETGMNQARAVVAARELGYDLIATRKHGVGTESPPTLKRLMAALPAGQNYVVGVKGHWLALVGGQIVDNVTNSSPARKVLELYEVKRSQRYCTEREGTRGSIR